MTPRLRDACFGLVVLLIVVGAALVSGDAGAATLGATAISTRGAEHSSGGVDPRDIPGLIAAMFGPHAAMAQCIAGAESAWQRDAVNLNPDGSRDRGVFQINSRWHGTMPDAEAFDPVANVRYAFLVSRGGTDWSAWSEVTRARCGIE